MTPIRLARAIALLLVVLLAAGCGQPAAESDTLPGAPVDPAVPALAIHAHDIDGIAVALLDVRRGRGDILSVRWQYRNTTLQRKSLVPAGDGNPTPPLAAAAFLIDPQNGKKYHVLRDADDRPVVSRPLGAAPPVLRGGESFDVWARFPAPSGTVTTVSVYIPGTAPFENVSIVQ